MSTAGSTQCHDIMISLCYKALSSEQPSNIIDHLSASSNGFRAPFVNMLP